MEQQNNQANFSVMTTSKSNKGTKKGLIIGALIVLFLAISIPVGVYLVKQQQNLKEKAEEAAVCPAAEACPVAGEAALLRSCNSLATGEIPQEVSCSTIAYVGTTAVCGGVSYCCPLLGAAWTTDLTLCTVVSPTPTATPTEMPTESPTPTATPTNEGVGAGLTTGTPTATPTPTTASGTNGEPTPTPTSAGAGSATPMPIPVTGTNWPTLVGAGVGILVIIGSLLLVL